jgi:hypothetical protein
MDRLHTLRRSGIRLKLSCPDDALQMRYYRQGVAEQAEVVLSGTTAGFQRNILNRD